LLSGLCEDMIACLASWRLFPVTASTSTLAAGRDTHDPVAAGRRVGARYVVAGSLRTEDRQVHVSCRLIDCVDDLCLWADRFRLAREELLAASDDAARRIAACLHRELERFESRRIERMRAGDMSAWDYYAQGQHFLGRCSAEGNELARECYLRALKIEPEFADALTGLATTHNWDVMFGAASDRPKSLHAAEQSSRRAVQLDWTSSMAHLRLGGALTWLERLDEAMAETEIAVELDPSNAHARMAFGNRLDLNGRPSEGVSEMREGLRLNPLDPRAFTYMGYLARAILSLGDTAGALNWAARAARARPDHPDVQYRLAICLAHANRADDARGALEACERLRPGFAASRASWRPYRDPDRNARVFAGLERHGLRARA
jgi:TolB-like protein/Flp pilus assembly protein TadD